MLRRSANLITYIFIDRVHWVYDLWCLEVGGARVRIGGGSVFGQGLTEAGIVHTVVYIFSSISVESDFSRRINFFLDFSIPVKGEIKDQLTNSLLVSCPRS